MYRGPYAVLVLTGATTQHIRKYCRSVLLCPGFPLYHTQRSPQSRSDRSRAITAEGG
jgi:hypothetical protein